MSRRWAKDMHRGLAAVQGEVKALRGERAQEMRRLAQAQAGRGARGEAAEDDEEVFGDAWPLIVEWRGLKDTHPNRGSSLSWLVTEERFLSVELALLEEHGMTLPPETYPLKGFDRNGQLNWRRTALYDTRRARAKRKLLRWVRRILTLGLWRK